MKTTKSDYFFTLVFLFASIITLIAGIEIWPAEERFETFWFSIIFFVFLEAIIFLKPIVIEHLDNKKGGFLISLISLSFTYTVISFVFLIATNLIFKGESPWPILISLFWTIIYLFWIGIFIKSSNINKKINQIDDEARVNKIEFSIVVKEYLLKIQNKLNNSNINEDSINSNIIVIKKFVENMSTHKSNNDCMKIEKQILDEFNKILNKKEFKYLEINYHLNIIKEKLRIREKILKI
jgi:hypothetical protein